MIATVVRATIKYSNAKERIAIVVRSTIKYSDCQDHLDLFYSIFRSFFKGFYYFLNYKHINQKTHIPLLTNNFS